MNYKQVAIGIIGGKQNVEHVTHCATRLRFNLKNDDLVNTEQVKSIKGVISTANKGGQFQVIIGTEVSEVYNEIYNQLIASVLVPIDSNAEDNLEKKTEKK